MDSKEKFRLLCEREDTIPVFSQAWWLDTVCGVDGWEVVIHEKGGQILGALPFTRTRKMGVTVISCPRLTQVLGIWLAPSQAKYAKRLGQQKDVMQSLVRQLPKHQIFVQSFHHQFQNWTPLFWLGFEQITKYTYLIPDLSCLETVWNETNANIRTDIRKAKKQQLVIRNDLSVGDFHRLLSKTYERQGKTLNHSLEFLTSVVENAVAKNSGRLFFAVDKDGTAHAATFIVWDKNSAYYLLSGADPELRNSGAGSFCLWEAIKFSSSVANSFDFEGSMVEGIERFFRGFGAKQTPYFRLMKFSSFFYGIMHYLRRRSSGKI